MVILIDLVYGEVLGVDVRLQLRLKWCADAAQTIPLHSTEERMLFDFVGTVGTTDTTETMLSIANQPTILVQRQTNRIEITSPFNEILGLRSKLLIRRKVEVPRPVDNLSICVMRLFSAEWRPSDKTFKHDCANRPPITTKVITLSAKDFRSDVIRRSHGRVSKLPAGLPPSVDLGTVADSQLDLVQIHRVTVVPGGFVWASCEELLVVRCFVLFVESS